MSRKKIFVEDRFGHWDEFLEEWIFLSRRYERNSGDLSFWHTEMTAVSLLSSAINRSGFSSIVEFRQRKTSSSMHMNGRGDLYIANKMLSEYVECKIIWLNACGADFEKKCAVGLEAAVTEAKRVKIGVGEGAGRTALLITCPWVKPAEIDQVENMDRRLDQIAKDIRVGATAWHFPKIARQKGYRGRNGRIYLGAAIMIKNVKYPTKFEDAT